jgi:DNA-binding transcriptional ArsR family regulator
VDEFLQTQERLYVQDPIDRNIEYLKEIIHLADSIAMTIYFSSGVFAEKEAQNPRGKILSLEEKRIFFEEISSAIKSLSQVNYASIIHHLVETLEALIPANPPDVFLLVNHVVKAGKTGGYQYESLAVDHIVQIVERYLAEYRLVIRENPDCQRALLEILDIFVEAGWPNAQKLTYRLEEIYR